MSEGQSKIRGKGGAVAHRPIREDARVVANAAAGNTNRRLVLDVAGWPKWRPGQFVMLSPGALSVCPRHDPLLPRPMAIYRSAPTAQGARIEILYQIQGRGTALLAEARPGQRVRVLGPLGQGFELPAPDQLAILVGGGTGVASLYELAQAASAQGGPVTVILGAREAGRLLGADDFGRLSVKLRLVTEDGSLGEKGLVTEALEAELGARAGPAIVYACGPTAMLRRCAEIAAAGGAACVVSLENTMACGFGVCLGCAVPLKAGGYALVCSHGPVFDAAGLDWEGLP